MTTLRFVGFVITVATTFQSLLNDMTGSRDLSAAAALCDTTVTQLGGYLKGNGDSKLFYWFFESRSNPQSSPTLIYFQGGPGASSMYSIISGNGGPCKVNDAGTDTIPNEYSYNTFANVLYLDQPALVGFSEGTPPTNSIDAAKSTLSVLEQFFAGHPQYNTRVFLIGQSYAGHYIPALAEQMHPKQTKINLKGIAIANGLVSPETQFGYLPKMAFASGTAPSVITKQEFKAMEMKAHYCIQKINNCNKEPWQPGVCKQARDQCLSDLVSPILKRGIDTFDLRRHCPKPPTPCRSYKKFERYFNNPKVQEYLGIDDIPWIFFNTGVYNDFASDYVRNYNSSVSLLTDAGLRVLIYAGDQDYICNWLGNRAWTRELQWKGHDGFNSAPNEPHRLRTGETVGNLKSFTLESTGGQLTFLQVFGAGHNVAEDVPEVGLQLMKDFVADTLR